VSAPFAKKLFHLSDFPLYTKRLVIRPLRPTDAEQAYVLIDLDKEVSRFINRANSLKQKTERFEKLISGYESENYGYFAIAPIETDDQLIGWVGLTPLEGHPYTQLLYGLARKFWGQGLASEAAAAMMRYGFQRMHMSELVAVVNPQNTQSRKLLEKIGMTPRGHLKWPREGLVDVFGIRRREYKSGSTSAALQSPSPSGDSLHPAVLSPSHPKENNPAPDARSE
ncbi:MAG TPA: GNAT family N-acetyltransferase, partial [Tepidisphaeraceae bacterium]|nr:GNAT family N-acetyltransferase [Tepidisphaeraceae bacterium]